MAVRSGDFTAAFFVTFIANVFVPDFAGPAALPEYLHVEDFTKSCLGHPLGALSKCQYYWR